jgi:hypothetical protein
MDATIKLENVVEHRDSRKNSSKWDMQIGDGDQSKADPDPTNAVSIWDRMLKQFDFTMRPYW